DQQPRRPDRDGRKLQQGADGRCSHDHVDRYRFGQQRRQHVDHAHDPVIAAARLSSDRFAWFARPSDQATSTPIRRRDSRSTGPNSSLPGKSTTPSARWSGTLVSAAGPAAKSPAGSTATNPSPAAITAVAYGSSAIALMRPWIDSSPHALVTLAGSSVDRRSI